MIVIRNFKPTAACQTVDVSSSNQQVTVPQVRRDDNALRVYNEGSATVFVSIFERSGVATVASSTPVGAGIDVVFGIPQPEEGEDSRIFGVIAAGATGKVYIQPGLGS